MNIPEFFRSAVTAFRVSPSEFWKMTPVEFWWLSEKTKEKVQQDQSKDLAAWWRRVKGKAPSGTHD